MSFYNKILNWFIANQNDLKNDGFIDFHLDQFVSETELKLNFFPICKELYLESIKIASEYNLVCMLNISLKSQNIFEINFSEEYLLNEIDYFLMPSIYFLKENENKLITNHEFHKIPIDISKFYFPKEIIGYYLAYRLEQSWELDRNLQ